MIDVSNQQVRRIHYTDLVWVWREPYPPLLGLLTATDCLIVLSCGGPPFDVVLGVPHHAAVGQERICGDRRDMSGAVHTRDSDENAASYALVAFSTLGEHDIPCKLVIMAHATAHDPNKQPDTPYCTEVLGSDVGLLFECHGAGPARRLALELSAGNNRLCNTLRFGTALGEALGHRYSLGIQKAAGKSDALILDVDRSEREGRLEQPAMRTCSLSAAEDHGMQAFHLEAKPAFRKPADGCNTLTPDGLILGRAIGHAIADYLSTALPGGD